MIHAIIQTERRKSTPDNPRELALNHAGQLHSIGERIDDPTNILYAAQWDGVSPWVTVLIGSISDLKMAYAGWPMQAST